MPLLPPDALPDAVARPAGGAGPSDVAAFDPSRRFGLAYRCTEPPRPAGGGFSGAGVWRVPTEAGPFALRLWPADPPPRDRLDGLHALLRHVERVDPGLPLAVPVRTTTGETLFPLAGRLAQWEPWRPGSTLPREPSESQLTAAATALARFHAAAESFIPSPAARPFFVPQPGGEPPSLAVRRDRLGRWLVGGGERAGACLKNEPDGPFREHAQVQLAALAKCGPGLAVRLREAAGRPVPLLPVLRDVHREHLLMEGDRVTGLIDPSAALADSPAADLARLAGSLAPGRLGSLVIAYRAARALSEAEERLARVLHDSGVLLSGLAWVARGTWEGRPDARAPAALDRLAHFAAAVARSEPTP